MLTLTAARSVPIRAFGEVIVRLLNPDVPRPLLHFIYPDVLDSFSLGLEDQSKSFVHVGVKEEVSPIDRRTGLLE
jgi:hypothetical protein